MAHAEHVLAMEVSRQKGAKKAISSAMRDIQRVLRKELGDDRYRLPSSVKSEIESVLGEMEPDQIKAFANSLKNEIGQAMSELDDSEDAVDDAKENLQDFADQVDGVQQPEVLAEAFAQALRDQETVDRSTSRSKNQAKKTKSAIRSIANSMGMKLSDLPGELRTALKDDLKSRDVDQIEEFVESFKAEAGKINAKLDANPEDADLMFAAANAMGDGLDTTSPQTLARSAALQMAAERVADPMTLGGQEIGSRQLDSSEMKQRGMAALDKYKKLPPAMQEKAAKKLAAKLKKMPKGPARDEAERILDGVALAMLASAPEGEIPNIPGRKMSGQFAHIAKQMVKDGTAASLLGPTSDIHTVDHQLAVRDAMQNMTDEALAATVKDTLPEMAELLGDGNIRGERRELLRNITADLAVDNMAILDSLIEDRAVQEKAEFTSPTRRYKLLQDASRGIKGKFSELLEGWKRFNLFRDRRGSGVMNAYQNTRWQDPERMDAELALELRLLNAIAIEELTRKEFGKNSESHAERAVRLFIETRNPDFLRSEPDVSKYETGDEVGISDSQKKTAADFRSKPYIGNLIDAGEYSCALRSSSSLNPGEDHMSHEDLLKKGPKAVTAFLDDVADLIQTHHKTLGIPEKVATDYAWRTDLLSDNIEKRAYQQGHGQGFSPGSDDNTNAGPAQPFNPAEIGKEDATPPETQPDEPYMKKNFIQEEFNELRHFQEGGLFSNAKAASEVLARMEAKIAGMRLALLEAADSQSAAR